MKVLLYPFRFYLLILCWHATAQQNIVAKVIDAETKQPIHQAKITIQETLTTTLTNAAGYFQLSADTTNFLIVESPGYDNGLLKVPKAKNFLVQLKKGPNVNWNDGEYEKGLIDSGYRVGIWQYYDEPGKISIKINHSTGEFLYLEKDTSRYIVTVDSTWSAMPLDIHPRYIGSRNEFIKIIASHIRYPAQARRAGTVGTLHVLFEVDTTGQAVNFSVIDDIGNDCGPEAIRALSLVPNHWTVATKGSKKYRSRFIQPITFKLESGNTATRNKKKSAAANLPEGRKLEELVIVGYGSFR